MKNKNFIRTSTVVWALMLLLLLSPMIGTTVWADKPDKPDKPGKPSPEPETFNYQISIGIGDLIGEEVPKDLILDGGLVVVEDVYSGRWLPPPTKGKYNIERWRIDGVQGDCGTYIINNEELTNKDSTGKLDTHGIDSSAEAYGFTMEHHTQNHPQYGENDYWVIGIAWYGTKASYPDTHIHALMGVTNMDAVWEGEYNDDDEITDTWTVEFNEADFWFFENPDNDGDIDELWYGQLSFTVKIERTPVEY